METPYQRVCLKLTGESLSKEENLFTLESLEFILEQLKSILSLGLKIGLVLGGGNIIRGKDLSYSNTKREIRDTVGMLATIMNALVLASFLSENHLSVHLSSSFEIPGIVRRSSYLETMRAFSENQLVIFAGGLSNPYFSTDTTAVLRALEMKADILLKGTKVEGIFDEDPASNPSAKKISSISYQDFLHSQYQVMDLTAITLAYENSLPIGIFNFFAQNSLKNFLTNSKSGTMIK